MFHTKVSRSRKELLYPKVISRACKLLQRVYFTITTALFRVAILTRRQKHTRRFRAATNWSCWIVDETHCWLSSCSGSAAMTVVINLFVTATLLTFFGWKWSIIQGCLASLKLFFVFFYFFAIFNGMNRTSVWKNSVLEYLRTMLDIL